MNKVLNLAEMQHMSIDDIVALYRDGYVIEENVISLNSEIISTQGVTISTGALLLVGTGILAYMIIKKW